MRVGPRIACSEWLLGSDLLAGWVGTRAPRRELAAHAAFAGVMLLLEPLSRYEDAHIRLVGVLGRANFEGWLTLECGIRGALETALRQAVQVLTDAWARSCPPSLGFPATAVSMRG
jgi:hypothetical protein